MTDVDGDHRVGPTLPQHLGEPAGGRAHVEAEIDIGEIIIQGTVIGNVRATRAIEIRKPGRVKGDLTTPSLQIERGVVFEGRSFMEDAVQKAGSGGARPG